MFRRIFARSKSRNQQRSRFRRCQFEWMESRTLLAADLSITKSADTNLVIAGEELFYNIFVNNSGPDPAADVEVVDVLQPGVTFLGDTAPNGCNLIAGAVNCFLGT